MRYLVHFGLLPWIPALAVFLGAGFPVDRIIIGAILALVVGAVSAWLARRRGDSRDTAAVYAVLTIVASVAATAVFIAAILTIYCDSDSC